jgi:catechol 2,3-dioxygenase-like lactoylglutathione lyase family enzyme
MAEMDAHFGYMAVISGQPEGLADYYARYFDMWELGRSDEGDISITDSFLNVSILKQRPGVEGASGRPGLSHFGIAVVDIRTVEAHLKAFAPNADLQKEPGDLHHGEYRVLGPNGLPVSLSTRNFGVSGTPRRVPRIRHMAVCFPTLNDDQAAFLVNVFGFREVSTSLARRKQGRPSRFIGDGNVCLALLSSEGVAMSGAAHEVFRNEQERAINSKTGLQHFGFVVEDIPRLLENLPPELARMTNKRPAQRDMAEYRVFDPDLNAIDLSQHMGFEVDVDRWENAQGSGLTTAERLAV